MGPVKRAEPATNCRWIDADRKRKRESNGVGRTRLMGPRQTLLPAAASSRSAAAQEHPPSSSCKTRFLSLTLIIRVLTFKGGLSLSSSSSSSSSTPSLWPTESLFSSLSFFLAFLSSYIVAYTAGRRRHRPGRERRGDCHHHKSSPSEEKEKFHFLFSFAWRV